MSAPLGYGPSSADPETGEIVSATLYLYGASLDVYAQFAADSVDMKHIGLESVATRTPPDYKKSAAVCPDVHNPEAGTLTSVERSGGEIRNHLPAALYGLEGSPCPAIKGG